MRVVASSMDENANKDVFSHDDVTVTEADVLAELIYDSVTTLLVGEKVMFEAPTFFFPSGAGVIQNGGGGDITVVNHGQPDPMATFRFAEPVMIDCQQNFRVEISFPRGIPGQNGAETGTLARLLGPFRLWVMLDGYLTRDVQ